MPLKYRNFKAWIHCEGDERILEEFNAEPDTDDEKVYTCWIASESGKNFRVYWDSVENVDYAYRGVVSVDGVETDRFVHMASHKRCSVSRGVKTGTGNIRPYAFADVILTDDDSYLGFEQSANTDELGNITVKIYLVKAHYENVKGRRWARGNRPRPRQEVTLYDGAIHESTKKICYHRIALGEAAPFSPSRRSRRDKKLVWRYLDQNDTAPHVVFRFMYRPRAFLQAQGIIPTPACIEGTPHKFFLDLVENNDTITSTPFNYAGRKRKRPLSEWVSSEQNVDIARTFSEKPLLFFPTSSHLCKSSQTPRCENTLRPVFFETPRPVKKDEDLIFLGYSERKGKIKQNENLDSPLSKRVKLEFMTPIKPESGLCLWMDGDGSIDLTKD